MTEEEFWNNYMKKAKAMERHAQSVNVKGIVYSDKSVYKHIGGGYKLDREGKAK